MKILDKLVKNASRDYDIEVKYPSFAINKTRKQIPLPTPVKDDNSPPVVTYTKHILQRTHSDKYDLKKDKSFEEYQLKNPRLGTFRQTKSEEAKTLIKQDSKENRRDWLKKQLSVNHHYLKDLKMPITSISHRNAMLNTNRYRLKASSCPDIFKNSMITINEKEEVRICITYTVAIDRF